VAQPHKHELVCVPGRVNGHAENVGLELIADCGGDGH